MSLSERCERAFTPSTRDKGQEFEELGRVAVQPSAPNRVTAQVAGWHDDYNVTVDWSDAANGVAALRCTCPHFRDGSMCKHLWAAILASDAAGLTSDVPPGGRLRLERLDAEAAPSPQVPAGQTHAGQLQESPLEFDPFEDDPWESEAERRASGKKRRKRQPSAPKEPPRPMWERAFDQIAQINSDPAADDAAPIDFLWEKGREAIYALDLSDIRHNQKMLVHVFQRERKLSGEFGKTKPVKLDQQAIETFPEAADRRALQLIYFDCEPADYWSFNYGGYGSRGGRGRAHSFYVPNNAIGKILKELAGTRRLVLVNDSSDEALAEGMPLAWDDGPPYRLRLAVGRDDAKKQWVITGRLARGDESPPIALDDLLSAHRVGVGIVPGRVIQLDCWHDFGWLMELKKSSGVRIPYAASQELRKRLWSLRSLPWIDLPDELRGEERRVAPVGRLRVVPMAAARQLEVEVSLLYDGHVVSPFDPSAGVVDSEGRVVVRDREVERSLLRRLSEMGISKADLYNPLSHRLKLAATQLGRVVEDLTREGWMVEAEGFRLKRPGEFKLSVSSSIEWFELDGAFDFDGEEVKLPALLAAVRKGEKYVTLGDGSRGLLPDAWLKRFGALAELGEAEKGTLRFQPSQALLLDALLSAQEQDRVTIDARFAETRQRLRSFDGIRPAEPPASFHGELRNYQKSGLGWLHFLREYRFGGCLADDMGLGKTVQVLALLESRRTRGDAGGRAHKPSLAIVPKSLVFNWIDEAKRFAPDLRVVNYTGLERGDSLNNIQEIDLVVTTYGTLRRDVLKLKEIAFEYAILDEAQAIKNATSQSAKACRLIQADHRLAMTGTPVENHLGELWSLFEFLNPGMLGRSAAFHSLSRRDNADDESLKILSRALAPYLLRRTKQQVLTELPEKTEQTVYCDLEGEQRKQYNEIRDYYRAALAGKIADDGIERSKIQILEALLRLRQAACHPGLISEEHSGVESAKFEALLEQVAEIAEEGHKALVFSQFTSLLALLKPKLDERGLRYEYLDGRTRNRKEKVEKFQNDPKCPLFLISLKAGGHGLNLTAAEYVFILDPWWNPAVEAQAVDRAHRIGQTRPVFAYRIIARDTVEEKILELQKSKRRLADAILEADKSLLQSLTAEDLQLLLS